MKATKEHLMQHFLIRNMGRPRDFLGIEFAYAKVKMTLEPVRIGFVRRDRSSGVQT